MSPEPTAACLAVGTELLADQRLDTNSLTISRVISEHGLRVVEKRVVGDVVEDIGRAAEELLNVAQVVVITGGLGPTGDDLTRPALARAFGLELRHDAEVEGWLRERYSVLGRAMPELCLAMAQVVEGSRPLKNTRGSAPGLLLTVGDRLVAAFPGVPREMELMLERDLAPEISRRYPERCGASRTLLVGGVLESEVESRVTACHQRFGAEEVTILASPGVVRLVLSASGAGEETAARLHEMETTYRKALGDDVAGVEVSGLAEVVLRLLERDRATLATAESCTGGLVASWLTDIPGSSAAFLGGVVSYSNAAKEQLVGVPGDLLMAHGAVSEPVARAMAEGVRQRFGADWGIGITGIAGPTGGTATKPLGLVHWAVAGPEGTHHRQRVFPGDRAMVREWSASESLDLLRRLLLQHGW